MAAPEPARHLRAVNESTGEVFATPREAELQALVDKLRGDLKMAQRDVKAKNRRILETERDKARERLDYEGRDDVVRVWKYWRRRCGHEKAALTPMRFDAIRGILEQEEITVDEAGKRHRGPKYRIEDFKTAVDGCAFDHYTKPRKNGSIQHFDDIEWICRDGKNFEECISRAPQP